jgi:hypothetical protein
MQQSLALGLSDGWQAVSAAIFTPVCVKSEFQLNLSRTSSTYWIFAIGCPHHNGAPS